MRGVTVTVSTRGRLARQGGGARDRFFALLLVLAFTACGGEVTLVRDTPNGGIVTYTFQNETDVLTSSHRREAMGLIKQKCPAGSHIQKEGEVPKVSQAADRAWRGQMGGDRLWGIQFTCD